MAVGCSSKGANETGISENSSQMDNNIKNQNFVEAIRYADIILGMDPSNYHALSMKEYALEKLGKYEDALLVYDKIIEQGSSTQRTIAWKTKAELLYNMSRYSEAVHYDTLYIDEGYFVNSLGARNINLMKGNVCLHRCNALNKLGQAGSECPTGCLEKYSY
jgi:tetratricopeptide (TPR) repeat protein